jgi:hypothetical protein
MFSRWLVTNITSTRGTMHCRKTRTSCGDQLVICGLWLHDLSGANRHVYYRPWSRTSINNYELLLILVNDCKLTCTVYCWVSFEDVTRAEVTAHRKPCVTPDSRVSGHVEQVYC